MNATTWLTQAETALTALENASHAEHPENLKKASQQLGQLNQQLAQLPPASREQLRPHMPRLLGRINAATARLSQTSHATVGELHEVQHHGQALNAYLVSGMKNSPKK